MAELSKPKAAVNEEPFGAERAGSCQMIRSPGGAGFPIATTLRAANVAVETGQSLRPIRAPRFTNKRRGWLDPSEGGIFQVREEAYGLTFCQVVGLDQIGRNFACKIKARK